MTEFQADFIIAALFTISASIYRESFFQNTMYTFVGIVWMTSGLLKLIVNGLGN